MLYDPSEANAAIRAKREERGGEKIIKSVIFPLHLSHASREMPHKAPVMQAKIIVFSKSRGACAVIVQIVIPVCD